ncbi:MAG: endolytic transglycosylase MltG [Spirochaetia bacterium]
MSIKRVAVTAIVLIVFLIVSAVVSAGIFFYLNTPPDGYLQPVHFEIKSGDTLGNIAENLEEKGVIRSSLLLRGIGKIKKTSTHFQKGVYLLPPGLSSLEVHDYFLSGRQILVNITIPEGWTMRKIAVKMEESGITEAESFLLAAADEDLLSGFGIAGGNAEGFLYPDTYRFPYDYPAEYAVRHMITRFFEKLEAIYPEYVDMEPEAVYRKVTMASIVEREYMKPEEAPLIASVFYNRIKERMRLQSCATVVYVITEERGKPHPEKLFNPDLEIDSAFNTYLHWGLPPAPISNPGETAIKSAFFPAETDYLYFVLKGDGNHHFSKTYSQHNRAKYYYLKGSG